ncbi:MAG: hypothetical protein JWN78_2151 [Bacteroidota bacterium]|nr:hypothetical protein [Bacteroidota bacterium]
MENMVESRLNNTFNTIFGTYGLQYLSRLRRSFNVFYLCSNPYLAFIKNYHEYLIGCCKDIIYFCFYGIYQAKTSSENDTNNDE